LISRTSNANNNNDRSISFAERYFFIKKTMPSNITQNAWFISKEFSRVTYPLLDPSLSR